MSIVLAVQEGTITPKQIYSGLDNSNYHGTERIVQIEEGVRDTKSFFHETSNQETREFVQAMGEFELRSVPLPGT